MNPIPVLLNPASGGGRGATLGRNRLESAFKRHGLAHRVFVTRSEAHLRELAQEFASSGEWLVVAGGDTSFRIVATEVLKVRGDGETGPSLGFYASGSANDIARGLGVGNAESLCRLILAKKTRIMDVGRVVFQKTGRVECFVGSLSLGLGVAVNREMAEKQGSRGRSVAGWGAGTRAIRRAFRSPEVPLGIRISASGIEVTGSFTLVSFMNTPYYAGGLRPAPDASPFDGELDAVCVSTGSWRNTLIAGVGLLLGIRRGFKIFRSDCFQLRAERDFHVQLDGDVFHAGSECRIDLLPLGLRVASGGQK